MHIKYFFSGSFLIQNLKNERNNNNDNNKIVVKKIRFDEQDLLTFFTSI